MSTIDRPHAVIIGCGRVGAGLADRLTSADYTVTVVDQAPAAFRRLEGIDADRIVGVGYDRNTLQTAGIERARILAAVTNGDNTNIVVARTARERFRVPRVIARIYDPRRAAIYERLGIPTVASAQLTTELALRRLLPDDSGVRWVEPSARVCVIERTVPDHLIGQQLAAVERDGTIRAVLVRRLGAGIVATGDLIFQEGDVVYLAVANDHLDTVDAMLDADRVRTDRGRH